MATRHRRPLYVVTVASGSHDVVAALESVAGARVVRPLDDRRLVVSLRSARDAAAVAQLPGVLSVLPDRLEHPTDASRPSMD
jgi:AmiR/NasT family two-component response regulator